MTAALRTVTVVSRVNLAGSASLPGQVVSLIGLTSSLRQRRVLVACLIVRDDQVVQGAWLAL